jgi:hypothetical protein
MTPRTQDNQVVLKIIPTPAAQFLVVNLQVLSGTTDLASPSIALQHLFS